MLLHQPPFWSCKRHVQESDHDTMTWNQVRALNSLPVGNVTRYLDELLNSEHLNHRFTNHCYY